MKFLALVSLFLLLSSLACTDNQSRSPTYEELFLGDSLEYVPRWHAEPTSLDSRIANADLIVRARMRSVVASTARGDPAHWRELGVSVGQNVTELHVGALEYTFDVHEYIKGTGDSTIVAIIVEAQYGEEVKADVVPYGEYLLETRHANWDGRDAILFLETGYRSLLDLPANHYYLGFVASYFRFEGDGYTIVSPNDKRWLPAANTSTGPRGTSGAQRFLLGIQTGAGGASGLSGNAGTITLSQFKNRVQAVEGEIAAATDPDAYRACIIEKHRLQGRVERVERERGAYHTWTFEESVKSGQPAGTLVRTSWHGGDSDSTYMLMDNDQSLFTGDQTTGELFTTRPLPAGEYRVTEDWLPHVIVPCDGNPPEMVANEFVIITVNAPEGTVHEAFFDPAALQDSVGFSSEGGVLEPSRFTTFNTDTEITDLVATGDLVTMALSPYVDLTFDTLDFIGLDGSVAVSLSDGTGDATAGTITWEATAPWTSGDQLMLRIVEGEGRPVPKLISSEVAPSPEVFFVIPSIGARLHWDEMDDLEGESVTGYTLQWSYEEDGIWLPATCSNSDQLQCWARWRDNDFGRGDTLYFRVIAHSETYDSMPSPVFEFTSR